MALPPEKHAAGAILSAHDTTCFKHAGALRAGPGFLSLTLGIRATTVALRFADSERILRNRDVTVAMAVQDNGLEIASVDWPPQTGHTSQLSETLFFRH